MNINHDITAYEKTMKQYWLVNERIYGDYEIQHSKKSLNAPQAWWPLLSGQSAIITMRKKTTKVKKCTVISQQSNSRRYTKGVFFLHMQSKVRSQAKPKY